MLLESMVVGVMVPVGVWPIAGSMLLLLSLFILFRWRLRGARSIYFDPQDFAHFENGGGRELPLSASTGTFAPQLKSYIGVAKLLITISAASIAFGTSPTANKGILVAKIVLACSILFSAVFGALLQFFYEEYTQNLRAYTPMRYSIVQAFGFSSLVCFVVGYLIWAWNLG